MKYENRQLLTAFLLFGLSTVTHAQRDPYKWPFSATSIWNLPLHKNAQYKHAQLGAPLGAGVLSDEDYIVLTPNAPLVPVYTNFAGWDHFRSRCTKDGPLLFEAPIPTNYTISPKNWIGETPNAGIAILMPDGVSLRQTQPFARCDTGGFGTSRYIWPDESIYGSGIDGAHGGSHMSVLGGTIRLGELVPGGEIRHAIKMNVYGMKYLFYDSINKGCRWPALKSDGYAPTGYGKKGKPEPECRMGALLALKPDLDLSSLQFETGANGPAMMLAKTFQNYGAYIVDDTYWDVIALETEFSPEGRVIDEFKKAWGFEFECSTNSPFGRDMAKLFTRLHVVTNNTAETIGGGATTDLINRRGPIACDFGTPGSGLKCPVTTRGVAVTAVDIMPDETEVVVNETKQFQLYVMPNTANDLSYRVEVSDTSLATITHLGLLTARKVGTVKVTLISNEGQRFDISTVNIVASKPNLSQPAAPKKKEKLKHKVGDLYQGGIIIQISRNANGKETGLIASVQNLANERVPWDTKTPFRICETYQAAGYTDWYLPSIEELRLINNAKNIINAVLDNDKNPATVGISDESYWSSTEANAEDAWMLFPPTDFVGYYRKDLRFNIRAVRKF